MNLVVDANVIFASLIKQGKTAELLLNIYFNLFAPEVLLEEIQKHKQEILNKTKRSEEEFEEIIDIIEEIITFVPSEEFLDMIEQAKQISPDPNDFAYFAIALKLKCPIWSNDKKLKEQNEIKVYSTDELAKELKFS